MCITCGCSGKSDQEGKDKLTDAPVKPERDSPTAHSSTISSRQIKLEHDLLAKNDSHAQRNYQALLEANIKCFNLVSSPGSGKTSLLCSTINALPQDTIYVIEGDQQTNQDALRIEEAGAKALQINTGKACHLDAHQIGHAINELNPTRDSLLFIENIGNLVCPAAFQLGEAAKVVILSVTEGDDKPLKYPDMFAASELMIINKIDLLPYVEFDINLCVEYARRINPDINFLCVSATTGEGMPNWLNWIQAYSLDTHHA